MNTCLPETGSSGALLFLAVIGTAALVAGVVFFARGRRAASRLLVAVPIVLALGLALGPADRAEATTCPPTGDQSSAPVDPTDTDTGDVSPTATAPSPSKTPSTSPSSSPTPSTTPSTSPSGNPTPSTTPSTTVSPSPTTPTSTPPSAVCREVNDKSQTTDTDSDGVMDACDLDSDNDGILDSFEDANHNGLFTDDDAEGIDRTETLTARRSGVASAQATGPYVRGDRVANYLDLDSDNDGIPDLYESGLTNLNDLDHDANGVIDQGSVGTNGVFDIIETTPDSGVVPYPKGTPTTAPMDLDHDTVPNFLDLMSGLTANPYWYDMHYQGLATLDEYGHGFLSQSTDADGDGIMDLADTAPNVRGTPGFTPGSVAPPPGGGDL